MNNKQGDNDAGRRQLLARSWNMWGNLIDRLPDWIFTPAAEPPPQPPKPEAPSCEAEFESYSRDLDQRKAFHDETSKTIRRVIYALVGTCLFCVITLAGSPDVQLLTPEGTVKLPALNYDMGFQSFLVVGPVVLIALTIYLHIFVGQHRTMALSSENRQPMLPNFNSWTARLVVLVIFYWVVPVTLAIFTWKAWPLPYGLPLVYVTLGVAAGLVLLQIRRCPREWRAWGLPVLVAAFAIFCVQVYAVATARQLNLFKADLSEKDLRATTLSNAFLEEANLSGANLSRVKLSKANLIEANLSKAKLSKAKLNGAILCRANLSEAYLSKAELPWAKLFKANLSKADLNGATLSWANLSRANLSEANLSKADLSKANLSKANLSEAYLSKADLSWADLSEADLKGAILNGANLNGANLNGANLNGANLEGTNVMQDQLMNTCGDKDTRLPEGLNIILSSCPKDLQDNEDTSCQGYNGIQPAKK